jgi:hypothetical protein
MEIEKRNNLGNLINSLNLDGSGIEIGVNCGDYSEILLKTSKLKKIYLLDLWEQLPKEQYTDITNTSQNEQNNKYNMVIEKMKSYGERVQIIRKDCSIAFNDFGDSFFDFIYIDANHKYEYVKQDIDNWYPKLKNGGLFSGHDYLDGKIGRTVFGVKRAVDEFCKLINKTPIITIDSPCPSWYFVK